MKTHSKDNLQKKLLNYSLVAAAVTAGTMSVQAAVWSAFPNTIVPTNGSTSINFNGHVAFKISNVANNTTKSVFLTGQPGYSGQWIARIGGYPVALPNNYVVSSSNAWGTKKKFIGIYSSPPITRFSGNSFFNADKFIGVKFKIGTDRHYGWIKVNVNGTSGETKIISYGYEEIPNRAISTGTLPVELSSFAAQAINNTVALSWSTSTEVNNSGFQVERKTTQSSQWENIGFVHGNGTSNSPKNYSFIDETPAAGAAEYRLKQIDIDGAFEYSNVVSVEMPAALLLQQNYPNPFNPSTTIKYSIPQNGNVVLKVYNALGQEVRTLVNETLEAGTHSVDFNAQGLSSGVYVYRIESGNYKEEKKMLLLK